MWVDFDSSTVTTGVEGSDGSWHYVQSWHAQISPTSISWTQTYQIGPPSNWVLDRTTGALDITYPQGAPISNPVTHYTCEKRTTPPPTPKF